MSYTVKLMDDLPVVFVSFEDDTSLGEIVSELNQKVYDIFEAQSTPIYYLIDSRKMKFSFNDLMQATQQSTKGAGALLRHPNLKQMIVISNSKAISMVVKGLNTATFGNINAVVFDNLEEALSYVQANAA